MTQSATVRVAPGFTWDVQSHGNAREEPCVLVPVSDIERLSNEEIGRFVRNAKYAAELCRAILSAAYVLDSAKGLSLAQASRRFSRSDLDELLAFRGDHAEVDSAILLLETAFLAANKIKDVRAEVAANYNDLFVAIGKRDGFRCNRCNSAGGSLEIDHVHPVSKGGGNELNNLQLLCKTCNMAKGAKV